MYALNSGTKGGEFYTPAEVSYLLALIAADERKTVNKVYDPACGSGSLLLNFKQVLGAENVREGFFGQEINIRTYNLCRMNMFLHNVNFDHFDIQQGDTLKNPKHENDEPFDAIVSNPPYSSPWDGGADATLINDPRFSPAGVLAPSSKADLAFVMHILAWLSTEGTAAVLEFPGVLYRSGAEQNLVQVYKDSHCTDQEIRVKIQKAVAASPDMRDKKELIERFLDSMNSDSDIENEWHEYVNHCKCTEFEEIISTENLKRDKALAFIEMAFERGYVPEGGLELSGIMPPINPFDRNANRQGKIQTVLEKLKAFFNKYYEISNGVFAESDIII